MLGAGMCFPRGTGAICRTFTHWTCSRTRGPGTYLTVAICPLSFIAIAFSSLRAGAPSPRFRPRHPDQVLGRKHAEYSARSRLRVNLNYYCCRIRWSGYPGHRYHLHRRCGAWSCPRRTIFSYLLCVAGSTRKR